YPNAADDAENHHQPDVGRQAGADCADQEQCSGDLHHGQPAYPVGEPARRYRAECGAQQGRGDRESERGVADAEVFLNRRHGAVDHRAVIAEQKAAQRGYRRDQDYATAVFGFLVIQTRCRITDGPVSHVTTFPQRDVRHIQSQASGQAVRSPSCEVSSSYTRRRSVTATSASEEMCLGPRGAATSLGTTNTGHPAPSAAAVPVTESSMARHTSGCRPSNAAAS